MLNQLNRAIRNKKKKFHLASAVEEMKDEIALVEDQIKLEEEKALTPTQQAEQAMEQAGDANRRFHQALDQGGPPTHTPADGFLEE